MSNKQKAISHCKNYLNQLQLSNIFSESIFLHYYRKNNGANGNPFFIGINAADLIIRETKNLNINK